jgi:hypothetical protein
LAKRKTPQIHRKIWGVLASRASGGIDQSFQCRITFRALTMKVNKLKTKADMLKINSTYHDNPLIVLPSKRQALAKKQVDP